MIDEMILDELREQLLRCREDISTRTGNRSPRQEGLEDTAGRRLRLIDAALEKIDRGTYGDCEGCRRPIAPKRLKAAPWTRLCVRCVEATTASTGEGAGR
jgi:RNA polymerase-binding transcription factor DksA